jgi:hypothetical protein
MMDLSQRKEQWSHVYVRAIATAAGYTVYKPEVDDDSVDLGISGRMSGDLPCAPRVELQLKGTWDLVTQEDYLVYRLKRKNYDDLRYTASQVLVPRILVVVLIPKKDMDWHTQTEAELVVRRCGYWVSLQGQEPYAGRGDKVRVGVPRGNVFSVQGLRELMRRAALKEPL